MLLASILFLFVFKALFSLFDTHGRLLLLESFSIEKSLLSPLSLGMHLIVANSIYYTLHLQE